MTDILNIDITPATASPTPRSMLLPTGGVDPSSQRTFLTAALTSSNGIYTQASNEVDNLVSTTATRRARASAAGAAGSLSNSVDQKVATNANFDKAFKTVIEQKAHEQKQENFIKHVNKPVVPRLIRAAQIAANVGGEYNGFDNNFQNRSV